MTRSAGVTPVVPLADAAAQIVSPFSTDDFGLRSCPLLVVDCRDGHSFGGTDPELALNALHRLPAVTVALIDEAAPVAAERAARRCDIALTAGELAAPPTGPGALISVASTDLDRELANLADAVGATPIASVMFVQLLRLSETQTPYEALLAESLTYSTLLGGAEFARWLELNPAPRSRPRVDSPEPIVQTERHDDVLHITLNDPARHNAFSAAMRDALVEALRVAVADESITNVTLRGAGPSFCSGGDLGEFGTTPNVAEAHRIRMTRSAGLLLADLGDRVNVVAHGHCVGAGIELAAWCPQMVATADATFRLPELGMGLIPGAGGTASLPRRIGRHRAAWMGLTGTAIGTNRAENWRLVTKNTPASGQ